MVWQDLVIMGAQLACLVALIPTLRDRASWPKRSTCLLTGVALASMTFAFGSLGLLLATITTAVSAVIWLRMGWSGRPESNRA